MGAPMRTLMVSVAVAAIAQIALLQNALAGTWQEESGNALTCYDNVSRDAQLLPLRSKLAPGRPTLQQLADETLPTREEVSLIRLRAERLEVCRNLMLAAAKKHHPYLAPALELRDFKLKLVYVQLMQQRITYGNANRLLHEAWLEFQAAQADYDRAQTDAQRRAVGENLDRLARNAQSSQPRLPASGRMTCRWVGPTLYCDPY